MKTKSKKHRAAFFYITFAIIIALSLLFIFPFLKSIIGAIILTFVSYPLYKRMCKKFNHPNINAIITTLLVLIIILVPMGFAVNRIVKESTVTYFNLRKVLAEPTEHGEGTFGEAIYIVRDFISDPKVKYYVEDSLNTALDYITREASSFIVSLPKMILNIFITLVALFYFLRDGKVFLKKIKSLLPATNKNLELLFSKFENISKGIVYGYILTAIVQGLTALLGFFIIILLFSTQANPVINTPILWALILALFSMVPILGSGFVWVPMSLFYIVVGYFQGYNNMLFAGITLFAYGLIVVSNVDNIVRPILSGRAAKVHPLLIFVGIFGGLVVFGFMGIIVGPLVLALFLTYAKMYEEGRI